MRSWFLVLVLAVLPLWVEAQTEDATEKKVVTSALLADTTAVVPGKPFQVGVVLDPRPGWHTYWQFCGDSGSPTTLKWQLPEGFSASPITWPLPRRLDEPGDIRVYAYNSKTMLLVTIVPPAQLPEKSVTLHVEAAWLVCAEICIPEKVSLDITLPVASRAEPANAAIFKEVNSQVPSAEAPPYSLAWKRDADALVLSMSGLKGVQSVDFYPLPTVQQKVGHAEASPIVDGAATIRIDATGELRGVLVAETSDGRKGWAVSSATSDGPTVAAASSSKPLTLWVALLYGFIGGLILNIMPCVLPVISLKIFGFIQLAGGHPERILRHGLAFVGGIFAWFLGLGLLIVALKTAGHEVSYAFQFQNPWFNLSIATLVFIFALNLFGVFEIVLPGSASNALAGAGEGSGYSGSFFQGVFATLLATPCTAPFLGSALGFAFSQSSGDILAIFAAVALGMSSPYFLLSAQPGWMKILPRPGMWMERVKQFMGFPLLATLVWLLSVLGGQKGLDGVIAASAFLLCVGLACWVYGSFCGPLTSAPKRVISLVAIAVILGFGGWYFIGEKFVAAQRSTAIGQVAKDGIPWQPFTQKALDDLLKEGKGVFIDFTADWCLSCKVNERIAIDVPAVREAFRTTGVIPMKGDNTNSNPEIDAILKKYRRAGVPLYLMYPAGRTEPIVLPEVLTQQIVLDALNTR